jgi:hypothetical protein
MHLFNYNKIISEEGRAIAVTIPLMHHRHL